MSIKQVYNGRVSLKSVFSNSFFFFLIATVKILEKVDIMFTQTFRDNFNEPSILKPRILDIKRLTFSQKKAEYVHVLVSS